MSKNERVISDPEAAGWEFDPATGYWMWKGEEGTGGLWEQNGDDIYYEDGNVGIGGDVLLYKEGKEDRGLKITGDNSLGFDGSTWTFDATANNTGSALVFKTRRGEAMRIDSNGNVGIGASTPAGKLSVGFTVSTDGLYLQNTTGTNDYARFEANTSTGEIRIGGVDGAAGAYFPTFYSNGTERMRIDSDGNTTFSGQVSCNYILGKEDNKAGFIFANNSIIYPAKSDGSGTNGVASLGTSSYRFNDGYFNGVLTSTRMTQDGAPVIDAKGLIKTLSTLRKATMDETQDIRESLRDAIDELVEGFEHEIAAMPAPEPEVSTQDLPE